MIGCMSTSTDNENNEKQKIEETINETVNARTERRLFSHDRLFHANVSS